MYRKVLLLSACIPLLFVACQKKKPEHGRAVGAGGSKRSLVPNGMIRIGEGKPVFIARKPATVRDYTLFLRAVGEQVPEGMASPSPGQPLTGLSREQAARFAAWNMKRLPTEQEWVAAKELVGAKEGQIHLVQDWLPGTPQEAKARRIRDEMIKPTAARSYADIVAELRNELVAELARRRTEREANWNQVKPVVFEWLDKQLELEELNQQVRVIEMKKMHLTEVAQQKLQLANDLAQGNLNREQAIKRYNRYYGFVSEKRKEIEREGNHVADELRKLQDRIQGMTETFERVSVPSDEGMELPDEVLRDTADPPKSDAEGRSMRADLLHAIETVRKEPLVQGDVADVERMKQEIEDFKRQIQDLKAEGQHAEELAELQKLRDMIARQTQRIGRECDQEPLLYNALEKLGQVQARYEATLQKFDMLDDLVMAAAP